LVKEQFLQRPLLYVLLLVVLELGDILMGTLKDRALVLLAPWDNLLEFVDAFVDGLATTAFNLEMLVELSTGERSWLTFFVVVPSNFVPLLRSNCGLRSRVTTWRRVSSGVILQDILKT
jgi:hypothetical protein